MPASALARLAPADLAELERLYLEGQDRYSVNDFTGAAEQWTQLLKALPENAENRAIRANVLINIIAAYSKAYRRFRMEDGRKNIEYLRDAQAIVDDYRRQLRKTHGEEAEVDGRLEAAAAELERKLW